jgi:hypothetical protein
MWHRNVYDIHDVERRTDARCSISALTECNFSLLGYLYSVNVRGSYRIKVRTDICNPSRGIIPSKVGQVHWNLNLTCNYLIESHILNFSWILSTPQRKKSGKPNEDRWQIVSLDKASRGLEMEYMYNKPRIRQKRQT